MQHESTRIYQKAIALVELSRDVLRALPRGHAHLADQLRRSVTSIPEAKLTAGGFHRSSVLG